MAAAVAAVVVLQHWCLPPQAGVFLASMEAAGTAGISRPVTAWIEVLQPLREEGATLDVPVKVLSPPGTWFL